MHYRVSPRCKIYGTVIFSLLMTLSSAVAIGVDDRKPAGESAGNEQAVDFNNANICGHLALAGICQYLTGDKNVADRVVQTLDSPGRPLSFRDLEMAAGKLGFYVRALQWRRSAALRSDAPAIIRLAPPQGGGPGHFLLLLRMLPSRALLSDLPETPQWVTQDELWRNWDGFAMHVAESPNDLPDPSTRFGRTSVYLVCCVAGCLAIVSVLSFGWRSKTRPPAYLPKYAILASGVLIAMIGSAFVMCFVLDKWVEMNSRDKLDTNAIRLAQNQMDIVVASDEGEKMHERRINIINDSSAAAWVRRVVSSCGCAQPDLSNSLIPAHGSVTLSMKIRPKSNAKQFTVRVEFAIPADKLLEFEGRIIPSQSREAAIDN